MIRQPIRQKQLPIGQYSKVWTKQLFFEKLLQVIQIEQSELHPNRTTATLRICESNEFNFYTKLSGRYIKVVSVS